MLTDTTIYISREHRSYEASSHSSQGEDMEYLEGFPTLELLMRKTEKITKKIQELLLSAQEHNVSRLEFISELFFIGQSFGRVY